MNRQIISAGQFFLVVLGLAAWIAAASFALGDPTIQLGNNGTAPNIASAGAACGFAIAGGICFLGAVLGRPCDQSEDRIETRT